MRKLFAVVLSLSLLFCFTSCSAEKTPVSSDLVFTNLTDEENVRSTSATNTASSSNETTTLTVVSSTTDDDKTERNSQTEKPATTEKNTDSTTKSPEKTTATKAASSSTKESTKSGSGNSKNNNSDSKNSNSDSNNNDVVGNDADSSRTVYKTPTGKRYHYISSCGGKNSSAISLSQAKSLGLTPCQKCAM